jgi:hypothetical protein
MERPQAVAIQAFARQPMDRHCPSGLAMTRLVFVPRDDRVGRDDLLTLSLRAVQRLFLRWLQADRARALCPTPRG